MVRLLTPRSAKRDGNEVRETALVELVRRTRFYVSSDRLGLDDTAREVVRLL